MAAWGTCFKEMGLTAWSQGTEKKDARMRDGQGSRLQVVAEDSVMERNTATNCLFEPLELRCDATVTPSRKLKDPFRLISADALHFYNSFTLLSAPFLSALGRGRVSLKTYQ
jgi:hypothetical protein